MIDIDELRDLGSSPARTATYLHGRGWIPVGTTADEILWEHEEGARTWELVLPLDPSRSDLARRLRELFLVLEAIEGREPAEIARDIRSASSDVLRIRTSSRTPSGTAPIEDALSLITASRDLLLAAAASVDTPRAVLGSRKPQRATDFLSTVRLATEPGSFIVSLESPVVPDEATADIIEEAGGSVTTGGIPTEQAVPFSRVVTERTVGAASYSVRLAEQVLRQEADLTDFYDFVPVGISANFLEALARIGGGDDGEEGRTGVALSVRWAYSRRPPTDRPQTIEFPSRSFPVFSRAAAALRGSGTERDVRLVGRVVAIRRDVSAGVHTVTVEASVGRDREARNRRVRLVLDDDDAAKAIGAYQREEIVVARGDLHLGPTLTMKPVRSFTPQNEPEA
ncbi:MAG: OB-fold nucleic acid binding domain-containing protein [Frankia sp.]|nr:OB-fold nucleic acid binding domain-containing protein [Frankia sp.]